jgi:hypothetical protein
LFAFAGDLTNKNTFLFQTKFLHAKKPIKSILQRTFPPPAVRSVPTKENFFESYPWFETSHQASFAKDPGPLKLASSLAHRSYMAIVGFTLFKLTKSDIFI